jgi:hypothetical protein
MVAVLVLEASRKALHAGRRVLHQELLFLQEDEVAGVRGVDHIHVLDVGPELLHDPLQDALGAGSIHLHLDPGVRGLEELGHLFRAGQSQRGVPDYLAFFSGRFQTRVLGGREGGKEDQGQGNEAGAGTSSCHDRSLEIRGLSGE